MKQHTAKVVHSTEFPSLAVQPTPTLPPRQPPPTTKLATHPRMPPEEARSQTRMLTAAAGLGLTTARMAPSSPQQSATQVRFS